MFLALLFVFLHYIHSCNAICFLIMSLIVCVYFLGTDAGGSTDPDVIAG